MPPVRKIEEPTKRLRARPLRDETRDLTNEIREPIRENRDFNDSDNFNNGVFNGEAPTSVPRFNFALSSTIRVNLETHARKRFEQ